ncbi:MAG: AAA family ATPase [Phycisphaerales bacterium]|nr:MAG: AAA family ATPase [Phycisphaerales bacterium]
MISGSDILLVTKEKATEKAVKSVLGKSGQVTLSGVCKDISELRSYLSRKEARAAIIDIDPDPSQVLFELRTVLTAYPDVYMAVLCSSFTKELVLQAMQAGARHFLEKGTIESELSKELQSLIHDGAKKGPSAGSQIISVFSAGGGCGATTVAVNLANELRLSSSGSVLVIDLDASYGAVSTYLGIRSQYGIADVLAHKGTIDQHLIQSSAYGYMEDYHVLASPAGIETPRINSLRYENLAPACEACRDVYAYTVIDAPRLPQPTSIRIAGLSDIVLVVFQLTIKDVHSARSIVSTLTKSGIAGEKIMPVANRVKKRGPLVRLEDSKKAVGLSSCYPIRSDWRKAMKGVNNSRPLAQVAGRSALRADFRKLAAKVQAAGTNSRGKI